MSHLPMSQARRLKRPSWRDARLLVGILLVLTSVLAGSWVVARADNTRPVYAANRALLPGEEVTAADLSVASVHLSDAAGSYIDATQAVSPGTYVVRAVNAGELVPTLALGSAREAKDKTVSVPVDPAASAALNVGTVVDLWVSRRDPDVSGVKYLEPELLLEQAIVASVPTSGGGLGVGVGRTAVSVIVPADQVAPVISSVDQEARMTLVPAPGRAGAGTDS